MQIVQDFGETMFGLVGMFFLPETGTISKLLSTISFVGIITELIYLALPRFLKRKIEHLDHDGRSQSMSITMSCALLFSFVLVIQIIQKFTSMSRYKSQVHSETFQEKEFRHYESFVLDMHIYQIAIVAGVFFSSNFFMSLNRKADDLIANAKASKNENP